MPRTLDAGEGLHRPWRRFLAGTRLAFALGVGGAACAVGSAPLGTVGAPPAVQGASERAPSASGRGSAIVGASLAASGVGEVHAAEGLTVRAAYETAAEGAATTGLPAARDAERALLERAAARGWALRGDARLAELAAYLLALQGVGNAAPAFTVIDAASRQLGLVDPLPFYLRLGSDPQIPLRAGLAEALEGIPASVGVNRYGIAAVASPSGTLYAIVLSFARVELEPIPRHVVPGAQLRARGRLQDRWVQPRLEITGPDGAARTVGESSGRDLDFTLSLPVRGVYRLELLGTGPFGLEVLANFPVFVGADEPDPKAATAALPSGATEADAGPLAIRARLLALLNEARARAGAPLVALDDGLSRAAEAHSRDMVETSFFGHTSPTSGEMADRLRRAGLAFSTFAENLGRGASAEEIHTMLLESPGHRANALDPRWRAVGIGVAIDRRGLHPKIVATEDFGAVAARIDLEAARAELRAKIDRARAERGARRAEPHALLDEIAARGAARFIENAALSRTQVLEAMDAEMAAIAKQKPSRLGRLRTVQAVLFTASSLEEIPLDREIDPALANVGIGVAQGTRPDTGPNVIAVFFALGWTR